MPPLVTQTEEDSDVDVRKLWSIVWRHRWLIALFVVLSGAAGLAAIELIVPKYSATSSVRIDESGTATPVVDVLEALSTATSEIVTEQGVLASRTLAEATMDSLDLQVQLAYPRHVSRTEVLADIHETDQTASGFYGITHDLRGRFHLRDLNADTVFSNPIMPSARIELPGMDFRLTKAALKYPRLQVRLQPRLAVIAQMMSTTLVVAQPNKDANILTVTFTNPDSVLARDVPNVLGSLFIRYRQSALQAQARNTVKFLRGQIDTLSGQLRSAEDALETYREQAQLYEPGTQGTAEVQYVANLEGDRNNLDAERSSLTRLLADIHTEESQARPESAPSPYRKLLGFPTIMATPTGSELLATLSTLEDEKSTLLVRRKEADPDVQTIDVRIHAAEGQIENLGNTYLQSLGHRENAIDSTLASYTSILATIPAKEIEYARLLRQAKVYEDIHTLLETKLKESEIGAAVDDGSARMVDQAELPAKPISPNKPSIAALAVMLGLFLGVAAAFLREFMDRGVHTRDELAAVTGVPVLGLIPHIQSPLTAQTASRRLIQRLTRRRQLPAGRSNTHAVVGAPKSRDFHVHSSGAEDLLETRLVSRTDPRNPVSEAYRTLRTNITFAQPDTPARTLVLTSPMPGDGKSTSATNLAITLAQQGLKVLLVDADLRRGTLNSLFDLPRDPGLSNVLIGAVPLESAVHPIDIGLAEGTGGFAVLPTGTLPPNPAELLASARCRTVVESLANMYDVVLFDTPPMNLVTDAAVLGSKADAVIVVARAGSTTGEALAYSMEQLTNVRANVIGTILNDMDFARDARYAGYYGRYKYYQYYYYARSKDTP